MDGVGGAKGSGAEEAAYNDAVRQQDAFCGGGAGINANRIVHASSLQHFDKGGDAGAELAEVRRRIVGFYRHIRKVVLLAQMAFNRQRFHGIGMAGLQNDVDHPVGLILLHHLAQQLQTLVVGEIQEQPMARYLSVKAS